MSTNLDDVSTADLKDELKRREDSLKERFEAALKVIQEVMDEDNLPDYITESDHAELVDEAMENFWHITEYRFNRSVWAQSALC